MGNDALVAQELSVRIADTPEMQKYIRQFVKSHGGHIECSDGYFIGSIICIDNSSDAFQTKELEVVDGQQRLTTLCLLLTAIYNRLKIHKDELDEDDEDELPALRKSIICKGASNGLILCPQIQNHNQADFNVVMYENGLLKSAKREKNWGNRKIAKCYKYFLQRLDQDIEESGDAVKTLLEIKSKVSKAVLVKIEVGSHAEAYTLFESLNNRGTPLTAILTWINSSRCALTLVPPSMND